jgi:hypothetical protein
LRLGGFGCFVAVGPKKKSGRREGRGKDSKLKGEASSSSSWLGWARLINGYYYLCCSSEELRLVLYDDYIMMWHGMACS